MSLEKRAQLEGGKVAVRFKLLFFLCVVVCTVTYEREKMLIASTVTSICFAFGLIRCSKLEQLRFRTKTYSQTVPVVTFENTVWTVKCPKTEQNRGPGPQAGYTLAPPELESGECLPVNRARTWT